MKKISTRFALLMAAAAVVPLLAYGAVSIVSLRTGAQQAVIQGNLNVARRVGRADRAVRHRQRQASSRRSPPTCSRPASRTWQQDRILKNFVLSSPSSGS